MKIISKYQHIPFGPYLCSMGADPEFCSRLLKVGKTLTKQHGQHLAGAIEHQFSFDLKKDTWIEEEFKIYINTWITGFRQFSGRIDFNPKFKLESLWINLQKAGEYNPIHSHPDCNLSFVLFLEIPEEMFKEKSKSSDIPPGCLGLMYGESSDPHCIITHRVIKPSVDYLVMFPATLKHCVSHFNSKGIRTTVSGNISFISTDQGTTEGKDKLLV